MAALGRIDELRKRYEENQRRFFAPLANEYRKAGDLQQAISICQLHLADAPSNLSGQIVFGQALYDAGSFDESRVAFETAIDLDPENLIALRHLGDIARFQSDVPRAKEWYQRVLDADRRNDDVLALMAELNAIEVATAAAQADAARAEIPDVSEFAPPPEPTAEEAPLADEGDSSHSFGSPSVLAHEVKTLEIPAMPVAPERVHEPVPEPSTIEIGPVDFGTDMAETEVESTPATPPDSSFGFDVDLVAAATADELHEDDRTSDFGEVELPNDSPFGDSVSAPESSPFATEPTASAMEPAFAAEIPPRVSMFDQPAVDEPVSEPVAAEESVAERRAAYDDEFAAPAADEAMVVESIAESELAEQFADDVPPQMPSVLEYVESTAESDSPPAGDALLDFVPEDAAPAPSTAPAVFESFDLVDSAPPASAYVAEEAAVDAVPETVPVAEPEVSEPSGVSQPSYEGHAAAVAEAPAESWAAPVEEGPVVEAASTFESFDPIREMPTPVAPRTPVESTAEIAPAEEAPSYAEAAAPSAPSTEVFATETMAELYVRQGLRQEAIAVYRQLLEVRPDDDALRNRLSALLGDERRGAGSTARAFFANLAGRRATPVRAQAVAAAPAPVEQAMASEPTSEPIAEVESIDEPGAVEPPVEVAAPGGTLDALFGHSTVAEPDDSAAQSLAAAFATAPPITGRPTRAANDEVSLDRIFRDGSSTPSKAGLAVPRQSSSLRFDQFFTAPADAPPPSVPPPSDPGESEQFQSWLTGLKKP